MAQQEIQVSVWLMRTSGGNHDYYVRIDCGERYTTPHVFKERWKAEYEVAHYQWVFGLRDGEPSVFDYGPETYPNDK